MSENKFPVNNDLNPDGPPLPDPDKIKEQKAKVLIDEIVSERLAPIEAQLKELPTLIQNTVVDVINQFQQQQAQQPQAQPVQQPQNQTNIAELAKLIPAIMGNNTPTEPNQSQVIMDMIVQSYMKRMQMDIDSQFMNTYSKPVEPPQWLRENQPPKRRIEVE